MEEGTNYDLGTARPREKLPIDHVERTRGALVAVATLRIFTSACSGTSERGLGETCEID